MPEASKKNTTPDQMPEYQIFPTGSWHLLAAIMLMIAVIASTVVLLTDLLNLLMPGKFVLYFYLTLMVILTLMLVIPSAGLTRGYARGHGFLLILNLALCIVLALGTAVALVTGNFLSASIYGGGLAIGLIARKLYRSAPIAQCVEHFRVIWSIHRARADSGRK